MTSLYLKKKVWCTSRNRPMKASLRKFCPICHFPAVWSYFREQCFLLWLVKASKFGRKYSLNVCKLSRFTSGISLPKTIKNRRLNFSFFSLYLLVSYLSGSPSIVIAFGKEIRNCLRKGLFFQMTLVRWGCFFFFFINLFLFWSPHFTAEIFQPP